MEATDSNRVLTEKQLAEYLGVSFWTVRRWRLQDENPLPVLGTGRILYRLKTVETWLEQSEQRNAVNGQKHKHKKSDPVKS